jgi:hypothetical protein
MKITSKTLATLIVVIMFGGIFFSQVQGWWKTETSKKAAKYTSGEFAGQANPVDIRGSYTFGDVGNNFDIPAEVLANAFRIQTDNPAGFQVKSLEELYLESKQEVGTASVRLFVAFYLDLPINLNTAIYLPQSAVDLLMTRNLSQEQVNYLETHVVPNLELEQLESGLPQTKEIEEGDSSLESDDHLSDVGDGIIKGKTTFADLMEWGLDPETIERIIGKPLPTAPGQTVKDFCDQNGLSFGTIKSSLQLELDK